MTATDRNEAIKTIRVALKQRSGKTWSVRGGTGTAYGWITITAPPGRCDNYERMSEADRRELARLLGLSLPQVPVQGIEVAASTNHRQEYVDRAEGRTPSVTGTPYWD